MFFPRKNLGQKKLKRKKLFNNICKNFPKKFRFINKKVIFNIITFK